MKHTKAISRGLVRASDTQTIPPSVIINFIVAILMALSPILTALKTPASYT